MSESLLVSLPPNPTASEGATVAISVAIGEFPTETDIQSFDFSGIFLTQMFCRRLVHQPVESAVREDITV
jgi:hypothetical protein